MTSSSGGAQRRGLFVASAPAATILIRILAGTVFLSEGIQKFLFPDRLGVGRFVAIGIPSPRLLAPFVGVVEIVGGVLLVLGLVTRSAALVLLIDIMVAIATTKLPMLVREGFWAAAHEARTDWSMLLSCLFLVLVGAGRWSLDAVLAAWRRGTSGPGTGGVTPGG